MSVLCLYDLRSIAFREILHLRRSDWRGACSRRGCSASFAPGFIAVHDCRAMRRARGNRSRFIVTHYYYFVFKIQSIG